MTTEKKSGPGRPPKPYKSKKITFNLPEDLIEQLKNAVYWHRKESISQAVSEAISEYLKHKKTSPKK